MPINTQALPESPSYNPESYNRFDYVEYNSPFGLYPRLRLHSRSILSENGHAMNATTEPRSSNVTSSFSVTLNSMPEIDFESLKLALLTKISDPSKPICRYEIPGGGECRDADCTDLHLSRITNGEEASGTYTGLTSVDGYGS